MAWGEISTRSFAWTLRDRVESKSLPRALESSIRPEATELLMPWELGEEPMWPMSVIRGELRARARLSGLAAELEIRALDEG